MSAKIHDNIPSIPLLIRQKSLKDEPVFFVKKDFQYYLALLQETSEKYNCHIHAYALMSNYVYILATSYADGGVSLMMRALNKDYVSYINKKYDVVGALWKSEFDSSLIDCNEYLLDCMRFIEEEPVRCRVKKQPEDYEWTSFNLNAIKVENSHLKAHEIYLNISDNENKRLQAYRNLFEKPLDCDTVENITTALNIGLPLGTEQFVEKVKQFLKKEKKPESAECGDCIMQF